MTLKQKSIGRYISILYRQGQSFITSEMKAHGIGSGQYPFLLVLYDNDGITQESLSSKLIIDKGTTARAIDKLERAGFVLRKTNPTDRRVNNVFLTDKARELEPILYDTLASWTKLLLGDLSEEEKEMLFGILEKMVDSTTKLNGI